MRPRALATGALLAAALAAMLPGAARAAPAVPPAGQADGPPGLELVAVPAWVEAGTSIALDLRVEPALAGLELVVDVRDRVSSRIVYERTLEGRSLGRSLGRETVAVADLPAGAGGARRLLVDLGAPPPPEPEAEEPPEAETPGPPPPQPNARVPIDQEGVYPLQLGLREQGEETFRDRLVTHVVVFQTDEPPRPLSLAWVWPMGSSLPWRPDTVLSARFVRTLTAGGTLAQFADALGSTSDVPLTLAPVPATLAAWQDQAAGVGVPADVPEGDDGVAGAAAARLETLREAAAAPDRQVLVGPYTRADLTALLDAGLDGEVAAQLTRGADTVRDVLGIRPDPRTLLVGDVDTAVLRAARVAGVDRLLLDEERLVPLDLDLTLARPFEIRAEGRTFLAASADRPLAGLLAPPEGAASDPPGDAALAQRFLAGLAVVALEAPAQERGVVVAPAASWTPSADLLVAVLAGLDGHPALHPVTLDGYFARVPPLEGESAVRRFRDEAPGRLAVDAEALRGARRTLASLAAMLPDDDPNLALGERLLLLAESETAQRLGDGSGARQYLDGVHAVAHGVVNGIQLPREHTVSLTARRASIPVTIVNELPGPVRVRVRVASDKLLFPEGDTRVLELPPRSTTLQLTVETRTAGTFGMTLEVTSPDGTVPVGTATLRIRSTAVSGAALAVTFGAGVFLFGWWGNHIRRSHRARREEEEAEAAALAGVPDVPRGEGPGDDGPGDDGPGDDDRDGSG